MTNRMKRIVVTAGAAAFVAAMGAPALRADETIIEKRTEESHSYKVEPPPPVVVVRPYASYRYYRGGPYWRHGWR